MNEYSYDEILEDLELTPAAEKIDFCDGWPMARTFLEGLRDRIQKPKILKWAINLIIKAGDKLCG